MSTVPQSQRTAARHIAASLSDAGAFLAGDTALCLRFAHRSSRDLDFFTTQAFDALA